MTDILKGYRVLDLTRLLPGPLATLQLADHGAEVIKIEDTGAGDYARTQMALNTSMSHLFHLLNRGKKSVSIDLRQDVGRQLFLALVKDTDVVVENFRPGAMDRLGLGYETLKEIRPELVMCSISAFGKDGPYRDKAAHDINMCSYAGVSDQLGNADNPPALSNFQIADIAGGALTPVMGILLALLQRERTGKGAHLDISMTDAVFALNVLPFATRQMHGRTPARGTDMLTGTLPCYDYYETADGGAMAVGALEPKFWKAFCDAIDRPDLIARQMQIGNEAVETKTLLTEIFREKTLGDWTKLLEGVDCCVSPVLTTGQAMAHPQLKARGMTYEITDPDDGPLKHLANPIAINDSRPRPDAPAPRQGEHTVEILRTAGLGDDEIALMQQDGIIRSTKPKA